MKDLPADIAGPLRDLLNEELRLLVAREHRRLQGSPTPVRPRLTRGLITTLGLSLMGVGFNLAGRYAPSVPSWFGAVAATLTAASVVLLLSLFVYAVREARRRLR